MTNFEFYSMSKKQMALLLSIVEAGPNDFPNEIDKWLVWLDEKYDVEESETKEQLDKERKNKII